MAKIDVNVPAVKYLLLLLLLFILYCRSLYCCTLVRNQNLSLGGGPCSKFFF